MDRETDIYTSFFDEGFVETCKIYVNGELTDEFYPEKMPYNLGSFSVGDVITVEIWGTRTNINWFDLYFYYENVELLDSCIEEIRSRGYQIEEYTNTSFIGTVVNTSGATETMMFMIPYDDGWSIYVDGVETTAEKAMDCYMLVEIPEGEHEVILEFEVPGQKQGILITVISALILAAGAFGFTRRTCSIDMNCQEG